MKLDSGEVQVSATSQAAAVTVAAPAGTFVQAFATPDPLAAWAEAAEALPDSPTGATHETTSAGFAAGRRAVAARLAETGPVAGRFDLTEFQLARTGPDGGREYLLSGTNGAWEFAMRVRADQAAALFAALRGGTAVGTSTYDLPRKGRTPSETAPDVSGAYLAHHVDRMAQPGARAPAPTFPAELRGSGLEGAVRLAFVIDQAGRVRPSSVRLIGKALPPFALSARDALLAARYTAGRIRGQPVSQHAMQDFYFREP